MKEDFLKLLAESLMDDEITKEQYTATKSKIENGEISDLPVFQKELKELILATSKYRVELEQAMLFLEDNGSISKVNKKKYDVLDGIPVIKKSKAAFIFKLLAVFASLAGLVYGATIVFNPNPTPPSDEVSYDRETSPYEMFDNEIERCWNNSYISGKAEPADCNIGEYAYEVVQKNSCSVQDLESGDNFFTITSKYGNKYCIKAVLNNGAAAGVN